MEMEEAPMTEIGDASSSSKRASVEDEAPKSYTIILRGTRFTLSRDQCEFDSPNFFTSAFLSGEWAESSSRVVSTDRSPVLFPIILDYLTGYDINPVGDLPGMPAAVVRRNLIKYADYYGLDGLERLLNEPPTPPTPHSVALSTYGFGRRITLEDLLSGAAQLEMDPTKVGDRGMMSLAGEPGPPLVLIQNAGISIGFNVFDSFESGMRVTLDVIHRRIEVRGEPSSSPLVLCGQTHLPYNFQMGEDRICDPDSDVAVDLDGVATSLQHFREVLMGTTVNFQDLPKTPEAKILLDHLRMTGVDLPNAEMGDDHSILEEGIWFPLFATELWLVPATRAHWNGTGPISEFYLKLVMMKCETVRRGLFK